MWNKRRDEEPPRPFSPPVTPSVSPTPVSAPAPVTHSVEVKKEIMPVSSPVSRFEPANNGNSIGKSVKVVGQIYSKEDLFVDGTVEGTLEASENKLTIGPHGTIQASIKAREVLVLGTIQGNVEALERLEIRKDAKLLGDIRTARIVIEDGAYFKGSIDIIKPEPVKMVIWDLDETFWKGTISEGPVTLEPARIDLVRSLNRRGIVNGICSKNDLAQVKAYLQDAGIWDEFVFASVEWAPKGARVARIIEDAQLRPENIMMIDDSKLNLEEVARAAPGIRTSGPEIIASLLSLPELEGKDDLDLSRLRQYQLLERKLADRKAVAGGNEDFLRSCEIRVGIFEDCAHETARLFELINRTNQLNFTKRRPSEDEFDLLVQDPNRRTGFVRVRDRYGDYGICGFFSLSDDGDALTDFLFSCRILHMGVEQWVYEELGRPSLRVVGEVASSLEGPVDWIRPDLKGFEEEEHPYETDRQSPGADVLMVGGCDLIAVAQFLGGKIETDFTRTGPTGALIHSEHTDLLRQAAAGVTEAQFAVVDWLPFLDRQVFEPPILNAEFDTVVYSMLMDYTQGRYRHRETELIVTWYQHDLDATDATYWPRFIDKFGHVGIDEDFLRRFSSEFERIGPISTEQFQANVEWMVQQATPRSQVIFINASELAIDNPKEPDRHLRHHDMNLALDSAVARLPRAQICDVRTIVTEDDLSKSDLRHYHRRVYKQIAEQIRALGPSDLALVTPEPKVRPATPAARSNVLRQYIKGAATRVLRPLGSSRR